MSYEYFPFANRRCSAFSSLHRTSIRSSISIYPVPRHVIYGCNNVLGRMGGEAVWFTEYAKREGAERNVDTAKNTEKE